MSLFEQLVNYILYAFTQNLDKTLSDFFSGYSVSGWAWIFWTILTLFCVVFSLHRTNQKVKQSFLTTAIFAAVFCILTLFWFNSSVLQVLTWSCIVLTWTMPFSHKFVWTINTIVAFSISLFFVPHVLFFIFGSLVFPRITVWILQIGRFAFKKIHPEQSYFSKPVKEQ